MMAGRLEEVASLQIDLSSFVLVSNFPFMKCGEMQGPFLVGRKSNVR